MKYYKSKYTGEVYSYKAIAEDFEYCKKAWEKKHNVPFGELEDFLNGEMYEEIEEPKNDV